MKLLLSPCGINWFSYTMHFPLSLYSFLAMTFFMVRITLSLPLDPPDIGPEVPPEEILAEFDDYKVRRRLTRVWIRQRQLHVCDFPSFTFISFPPSTYLRTCIAVIFSHCPYVRPAFQIDVAQQSDGPKLEHRLLIKARWE